MAQEFFIRATRDYLVLKNVASCLHRMKDDWNKEDEILQLHMTNE